MIALQFQQGRNLRQHIGQSGKGLVGEFFEANIENLFGNL